MRCGPVVGEACPFGRELRVRVVRVSSHARFPWWSAALVVGHSPVILLVVAGGCVARGAPTGPLSPFPSAIATTSRRRLVMPAVCRARARGNAHNFVYAVVIRACAWRGAWTDSSPHWTEAGLWALHEGRHGGSGVGGVGALWPGARTTATIAITKYPNAAALGRWIEPGLGNVDVEHEQRDREREHPVAERLDPTGVPAVTHRGSIDASYR